MCVQICDLQTEQMPQSTANLVRSQVLSRPLELHRRGEKHQHVMHALVHRHYREMKCNSVNLKLLQTMLLAFLL